MSDQDLLSREQDAEAFLQAMAPHLMKSEFGGTNTTTLGQPAEVSVQKKTSVEGVTNGTTTLGVPQQNGKDGNTQKTWKNLEANLKILQSSDSPPPGLPNRSVSYKAKPNSSGKASSAFQIEKAQSFKAKSVNTNSAIGGKYKKVDITTAGDDTKEKAVCGIETVLGRHGDGHFKQTIDDEKMLIKKGAAVNGEASPMKLNEKKQESNKTSTIPSKPNPPPVASVAVKQEKTTTFGSSRQKPIEQQPIVKPVESVKPSNPASTAVQIPAKPAQPAEVKLPATSLSKPSPPAGVRSPAKSVSKPVLPNDTKPASRPAPPSAQSPATKGTVVTTAKPLTTASGITPQSIKSSTTNSKPVTTVASKQPVSSPSLQKKVQPAKANEQIPPKVTTPSSTVKTQPNQTTDNKVNPGQQASPLQEINTQPKVESSAEAKQPHIQPTNNSSTSPLSKPSSEICKPPPTVTTSQSPVKTDKVKPDNTSDTNVSSKVSSFSNKELSKSETKEKAANNSSTSPLSKPSSEICKSPPTVMTSQSPVKTDKVKPDNTSDNNVSSKVSSFSNKELSKSETKEKAAIPAAANFSQSKALIEKQFSKDKEPTESKTSEPIKIQSAGNFSQSKAMLEKQLKTDKQSAENDDKAVTQKSPVQIKPAANFSENRNFLEKQMMNSGTHEETDSIPTEPSISDDNGSHDQAAAAAAPPPPPPPPPPVIGGPAPPPPAGNTSSAPGGPPPPPPPPPPPMGFTVKKSCISDTASQSSSSAAKKPSLAPQDDASVAFLAELKRRTSKVVKGSGDT